MSSDEDILKQPKPTAEYRQIPTPEINELHKLLFFAFHIEVPYDESPLTMAKQAIARMRGRLVEALGYIDPWLNPALRSYPKIRDLPEEERSLFTEWMTGQTRPHLPGEGIQDGYYPQDYDRWQYEKHNRYPMCKDQPAQVSCLVEDCVYYKGRGLCVNISPAITLNPDGKFVCWSYTVEAEITNGNH